MDFETINKLNMQQIEDLYMNTNQNNDYKLSIGYVTCTDGYTHFVTEINSCYAADRGYSDTNCYNFCNYFCSYVHRRGTCAYRYYQ